MKKVRFESPTKTFKFFTMNDSECHSPRPQIDKPPPVNYELYYKSSSRELTYTPDPVQRYETANTSPYPLCSKSNVPFHDTPTNCSPSNELELSMLDTCHEPRSTQNKLVLKPLQEIVFRDNASEPVLRPPHKSLSSNESKGNSPPNILHKDNDFFIRRDNLDKFRFFDFNPLQRQLNTLDKENNPVIKKTEIMRSAEYMASPKSSLQKEVAIAVTDDSLCKCHHCTNVAQKNHLTSPISVGRCITCERACSRVHNQCPCLQPKPINCAHCSHNPLHKPIQQYQQAPTTPTSPQNAVDKKTWAIEKYEQNKNGCKDIERQTNITKEKREPTVSDLFKIIKLQNEQLQLLQEKVDKFISSQGSSQALQAHTVPENCVMEHAAVNTSHITDDTQHKTSIGVMTSFEVVRTSTVINKEIVRQIHDNAQIQCNKSQISIKEVVSKSQPVNLNFLDGIAPVKNVSVENHADNQVFPERIDQRETNCNHLVVFEEKTLNEQSLYNVQVETTTPLMSPEQTLYLDVRDYSGSDAGSDEHSRVGWTYYNKVMTHVNGMLQDSDMPSSASAMHRHARQHCVQMHVDKTNISVAKRVKFGDELPLQPHGAFSDTSLRMQQLASKYLRQATPPARPSPGPAPHTEMSFATRNYMERHQILKGIPSTSKTPQSEIPRFLDITALKQQPKLL